MKPSRRLGFRRPPYQEQDVIDLLKILGFAFATFFSLFLYMAIGMVSGDFAANVFLVSILVVAAMIAAGIYWSRRKRSRETS